jgi:hypothetical protein
MIEFTKSYKTTDNEVFATIEEAKRHELILALKKINLPEGAEISLDDVATLVLTAQEEIVDILTMTPNSKPKARKLHGGTKVRGKKGVITDATTSVTSASNIPLGDGSPNV